MSTVGKEMSGDTHLVMSSSSNGAMKLVMR